MKILVIPDSHAKPGVSNERYDWLGAMIEKERPDVVVDLGDFADMESLSCYDKGKRSFEGRRLKADIEAAQDARKRLTAPLKKRQAMQRRDKEKIYKPRLIALGGNHEERINRMMNNMPEFDGLYTQDVSGAAQEGWEFYPFLTPVTIAGVTFVHYLPNNLGKPSGVGKYPAAAILRESMDSIVTGHSHVWDFDKRKTASGRKVFSLVAGCYFEHYESYAGLSNQNWDRCVTLLHNVQDGYTEDIEKISIQTVQRRYGLAQDVN